MKYVNSFSKGIKEPDMKIAASWYPRMKNQYAPLGWKNSLFEFLVLWNGDIAAPTKIPLKRGLEAYHHADAQFNFHWKVGDLLGYGASKLFDNSPIKQEYLDGWKPVIISTSLVHGLEIKETAFVHFPKTGEVTEGDENLFMWVDFDIKKAIEILVPENEISLFVQINAHSLRNSMEAGINSYNIDPAEPYAHELSLSGTFLLQDDGNIRLALVDSSSYESAYIPVWDDRPGNLENRNGALEIKAILENGRCRLRLLIPMLPASIEELSEEIKLGYDAALNETLGNWEKECSKGVGIEISDKIIENTFKSNPWRMFTIAEKNPVFKEYCINNGSFSYDALWPTPGCLSTVWGLDLAGYHKDAEIYLEVYRNDQGNTNPPGDFYLPHPGFLSTPDSFEAVRWVNEHGAVMWAVAEHYLITRDGQFLEKWLPSLLKACQWIHVQRNNFNHPGVKGIIPPGTATDDAVHGQFIWTDGWMYKGLTSVVRVLSAIDHPEAERWEQEAREYKKVFNEIFLESCNKAPVWTAGDGTVYPFIPTEVSGKLWNRHRHAFYLDTGPMFLAFAGIIDIENEIYDAVLKWFREGPQVKYWRFDGCCWQIPVLHHEMSSCEPCYSWNMEINFQRGDREHFIEGLFALLAGSRNTDLFSDIETRNGMFATNFSTPVTFRHFRNALVFENRNTLELLKILPAAFLEPGSYIRLDRLPTYFGQMSIHIDCDNSGSIRIYISVPDRTMPEKVRLHIPPPLFSRDITINGAKYDVSNGYVEFEGKLPENIELLINATA